jgi:hypothetical protein
MCSTGNMYDKYYKVIFVIDIIQTYNRRPPLVLVCDYIHNNLRTQYVFTCVYLWTHSHSQRTCVFWSCRSVVEVQIIIYKCVEIKDSDFLPDKCADKYISIMRWSFISWLCRMVSEAIVLLKNYVILLLS